MLLVGFGLPAGGSLELNFVRVVDEAVQNCVSESGVTDPVMPFGERELAGHDGRANVVTVFEDFQKVMALSLSKPAHAEVVEEEDIVLAKLDQQRQQLALTRRAKGLGHSAEPA